MSTTHVDVRPVNITWRIYQGDPASLRLVLVDPQGDPADVAAWTWVGTIGTSPPTPIECHGQADGVVLYLRGELTYGLTDRYWPFDVTGRHPDAGEGRAVARGQVNAYPRVSRLQASPSVLVAP